MPQRCVFLLVLYATPAAAVAIRAGAPRPRSRAVRLADPGDAAIRELLDARLIDEARELGRQLRLPVVSWSECVAPACDAAAAEGGVPSARAEEMTRQGRVAIVELDGIAPQTYCNLRGRLVRVSDEARGVAPARREEESPAELYPEALLAGRHAAEDRLIVYAFAPLDALEIEP